MNNKIEAKLVIQNKQDFLVGIYSIKNILKFTRFTERLIANYEDGIPIYNKKIQRFVENPRVEKIADFLINDPNATFPTNIVLHIPSEIIKKKEDGLNGDHILYLDEKVFEEVNKKGGDVYITIIDGQHRIRGIEVAIDRLDLIINDLIKTLIKSPNNKDLQKKLSYYKERLIDLKNINLIVSFFIDKTLEYQAMIFSTINRTQKRVSANLVYSLFGLDKRSTPQKTALQIALTLNGHVKSPFYKRIKLYGGDYSKEQSPPLSQSTFVKSIVNLICESIRESENDRFKERKDLFKRSSSSGKFLPFRKYYASEKDSVISDIIYYYFSAVKSIFKKGNSKYLWDFDSGSNKPNNIFQTTVGYDSLFKILIEILKENKADDTDFSSIFDKYLKKVSQLNITDINRYSFNNRGKKFLYLDMSLAIWPPDYVKNPKDKREQELKELLTNK